MTTSPTSHTLFRHAAHRERRAFTLLELLIVIAIISLLIVISLAVGSKVLGTGRESLSMSMARSMEVALSSYITDVGDKVPSSLVEHPETSGAPIWQPVADVRRGESYADEMVNSVGWFIYQMKDVSSVSSAVSGLPAKSVKQYAPNIDSTGAPIGTNGQPLMTSVFDAWGRPLRYVHPDFDGVITGSSTSTTSGEDVADLVSIKSGESFAFDRVRRNRTTETTGAKRPADGDGGICPNNRPYFYSAGADGDPATIEDNIYPTKPTFQTE